MPAPKHYDYVVIGSGLGGLVSAIILAKEGFSVCILEKNNQFGGNLQTFVRERTIFDTGVHYIGGLSEGQNLYQYFNYIDIMKDLPLQQMDEDAYDVITFDTDTKAYTHAQGYDKFIANLVKDFPDEEQAIITYCNKVKAVCDTFPLYRVDSAEGNYTNTNVFSLSARDYINTLTSNTVLQAVLAGSNYLYAGDGDKTPFYVHALSVNSYIESAYRCIKGGSQITRLLIQKLKALGGVALKKHNVINLKVAEGEITKAVCENGLEVSADHFISNVDPKITIPLVGAEHFRKSYVNRINKIESTIAPFCLYIVLKPNSFKYQNKNYYHFKSPEHVWKSQSYTQETWPEGYMISMGLKHQDETYSDNLTVMTYMDYNEVKAWENTFNTVVKKNSRGQTYDDFKAEKAEKIIVELEKKFPNIRDCIQSVHTSTPLSYRDYIGCYQGAMYGFVKDVNKPMQALISPRTKIKNLFLTGQCLNMHGILGVTISAVLTCSEILGRTYLLDKIKAANAIAPKTEIN